MSKSTFASGAGSMFGEVSSLTEDVLKNGAPVISRESKSSLSKLPKSSTEQNANISKSSTLPISQLQPSSITKPLQAPEKPLMPYMRYSRLIWEKVKNKYPELKIWELGRMIGQMWRDLPEGEKNRFTHQYEVEKHEYERKLRQYRNCLAQASSQTKGREIDATDKAAHFNKTLPLDGSTNSKEDGIDIVAVPDEEDDGLAIKHIAHARFNMNNKLLNEIFSDAIVPIYESESSSSVDRLKILKSQIERLTKQQGKLEAEVTTMEDNFKVKKMRYLNRSEEFQTELESKCSKAVDASKFKEMVAEELSKIKAEKRADILMKRKSNQNISGANQADCNRDLTLANASLNTRGQYPNVKSFQPIQSKSSSYTVKSMELGPVLQQDLDPKIKHNLDNNGDSYMKKLSDQVPLKRKNSDNGGSSVRVSSKGS